MIDNEVRDEVMTLMFAGHETTANALAWTWSLLSANPKVADALRTELDQELGDRLPTMEDLPRLPFTLQVFKEALRLDPPVYAAGRIATEPVSVAGYALPANSTVIVNIWGMHHRLDVFANPAAFDQSRFDPERERTIPRSSYLPFGAGPRVCIGNQFALVEGQILVATLAERIEFDAIGAGRSSPSR